MVSSYHEKQFRFDYNILSVAVALCRGKKKDYFRRKKNEEKS